MRNILISCLSVVVFGGVLLAQADSSQSLGDLARQQRTAKKTAPARVFTNDDLARIHPKDEPTATPASTTSTPPDSARESASTTSKKEASDKKTASGKQADAAAPSVEETYRNNVRKQRELIANLESEINDTEHAAKVQSTNYYMDAGARLRDPKAWTEQREKMSKTAAEKQEKLQEARTTLDRLLDEAHKLGIPESALE